MVEIRENAPWVCPAWARNVAAAIAVKLPNQATMEM
jgi:hypothetical protein